MLQKIHQWAVSLIPPLGGRGANNLPGNTARHSLILFAGSSARRHRRSRLVVFFLVVVMADLLAPAPQIAAILEH
jgi:hypothetical protein